MTPRNDFKLAGVFAILAAISVLGALVAPWALPSGAGIVQVRSPFDGLRGRFDV